MSSDWWYGTCYTVHENLMQGAILRSPMQPQLLRACRSVVMGLCTPPIRNGEPTNHTCHSMCEHHPAVSQPQKWRGSHSPSRLRRAATRSLRIAGPAHCVQTATGQPMWWTAAGIGHPTRAEVQLTLLLVSSPVIDFPQVTNCVGE